MLLLLKAKTDLNLQASYLSDRHKTLISKWFTNPTLMKYISSGFMSHPEAQKEFDSMLEQSELGISHYLVFYLNDKLVALGKLYQKPERSFYVQMGYMVAPEYQGRGIATEVGKTMLQLAFDLGYSTVEAYVRQDHKASIHILQNKLGMILTHKNFIFEGRDYYQFAINQQQIMIAA